MSAGSQAHDLDRRVHAVPATSRKHEAGSRSGSRGFADPRREEARGVPPAHASSRCSVGLRPRSIRHNQVRQAVSFNVNDGRGDVSTTCARGQPRPRTSRLRRPTHIRAARARRAPMACALAQGARSESPPAGGFTAIPSPCKAGTAAGRRRARHPVDGLEPGASCLGGTHRRLAQLRSPSHFHPASPSRAVRQTDVPGRRRPAVSIVSNRETSPCSRRRGARRAARATNIHDRPGPTRS